MPAAELPACVFCGEPIGPGEETAGRAPMAAHAACADAALADDVHWDAVSAASPAPDEPEAPDADETRPRGGGGGGGGGGCLLIGSAIPLLTLAVALLLR